MFASWDGEEYGLLGSTEWVEEYLPWLSHANVAYLNVDVGVRGQDFHASAAPLLNSIIHDVTAQIPSPNQTVKGQTVYDTWDKKISTLGSGSDYTAFQDFAGIPSIDFGFGAGSKDPVYHYHSNYDSFHWMAEFGDPGFVYHRTMSQILALATAKLADEPVLSFEAATYATSLDNYVSRVEEKLAAAVIQSEPTDKDEIVAMRGSVIRQEAEATGEADGFRRSLVKLHEAIAGLVAEASKLDTKRAELQKEVSEEIPWWKWPEKLRLGYEIRKVNTKYKYLDRDFIYPEGLDGRPWFKHIVFAPGLWTGYAGGTKSLTLLMLPKDTRVRPFLSRPLLFQFSLDLPLADQTYSCLPGLSGEYRREELYQRNSLVWYHRGLRQDGDCQYQGRPSRLDDEMAVVIEMYLDARVLEILWAVRRGVQMRQYCVWFDFLRPRVYRIETMLWNQQAVLHTCADIGVCSAGSAQFAACDRTGPLIN